MCRLRGGIKESPEPHQSLVNTRLPAFTRPNSSGSKPINVPCIFDQHDRDWQERSIFGKMRYISARGLVRKTKPKEYVEKVERLMEEGRAEAL